MVKALISALIGIMLTGVAAMAARLSNSNGNHETRISVIEDHQKGIDAKLSDMDRKLDRLLARR